MKRVLFGTHSVTEALASNPRALALVLVDDDSPRSVHRATLESLHRHGVQYELRATAVLDALARGARHQGIVAVSTDEYPYVDLETAMQRAATPELFVLLDEITDVHNFGAIVRSAVAMGASAVVTLRDRAAPVNGTVVRSSAGATEHATIARVTNLVRAMETLAASGIVTVGLDATAERALSTVDLTVPTALIVGSEGRGLRRLVRERAALLARIPMPGAFASLNASVAAGIALYEAARQRGRATGTPALPRLPED